MKRYGCCKILAMAGRTWLGKSTDFSKFILKLDRVPNLETSDINTGNDACGVERYNNKSSAYDTLCSTDPMHVPNTSNISPHFTEKKLQYHSKY